MDRVFDDLAEYYDGRIRYLPKFFEIAAKELSLNERSRLLDIACGTGELSAGFARHCGEIAALDRSAEMLARARKRLSNRASLILCDINETRTYDLGQFDAVAIGRALRYLDRAPLYRLLEQSLCPGGSILVCWAGIHDTTPWFRSLRDVANRYRDKSVVLDTPSRTNFDDSLFEHVRTFSVTVDRQFTIDDLLRNLFSFGAISARARENPDNIRLQLTNALRSHFVEEGILVGKIVSRGRRYIRNMGA